MAHWACGHRRADTEWSQYDAPFGSPLSYWAKHAADKSARAEIAREIRQRRQECPACRASTRKRRQHWAAIAVVALVLLLVAWRARG